MTSSDPRVEGRPRAPVVGVVLAAGAGSRMGRPKALVQDRDGRAWVERAVTTLRAGGCASVVVVLGAAADRARLLVPADAHVHVVVAEDWAAGPGASLRAALRDVAARDVAARDDEDPPVAVLVTLVDLPTMPAAAVRRVLRDAPALTPSVLRQAVYGDHPGHPVLIGRAHWTALVRHLATRDGDPALRDRGAGPWLRTHGAEAVDCADLWDGADRDLPTDLDA